MTQQRTHHLVTYVVSGMPMGESCTYRTMELRATDLRSVSIRLGANIAQVDEDYLAARQADLHHCPVCTSIPAAA